MTLKDRLNNELKDAMRARDKAKLEALRLISAAVKQIEVDERITVTDDRMLVILDKMAKQRKESITQFSAANRQDLVDKEEFELALIHSYLPSPLTSEEIAHLIDEAFSETNAAVMADMGKVMAILKPKLQGRCDMAQVSTLIKSRLA